jgi:hypothetical protein
MIHSECPRANGIRIVLRFNIQFHQPLIGLWPYLPLVLSPTSRVLTLNATVRS